MLRTETLKIGRAKNKAELKKLTSELIRDLQNAQKPTSQEKSWVEDGSGKEHERVASEERKEPYIRESSLTK